MILKVVIGIPAFNEEKNIAKIIVKLQKISDAITELKDLYNKNILKDKPNFHSIKWLKKKLKKL